MKTANPGVALQLLSANLCKSHYLRPRLSKRIRNLLPAVQRVRKMKWDVREDLLKDTSCIRALIRPQWASVFSKPQNLLSMMRRGLMRASRRSAARALRTWRRASEPIQHQPRAFAAGQSVSGLRSDYRRPHQLPLLWIPSAVEYCQNPESSDCPCTCGQKPNSHPPGIYPASRKFSNRIDDEISQWCAG